MTFVAEKNPYRVVDAKRGWEMTSLGGLGVKNFKLVHLSGASIVFSARSKPDNIPDGYKSQWEITAVGHKPTTSCTLTMSEQHELIGEVMSAYGYFFGDGAGAAFLKFQ